MRHTWPSMAALILIGLGFGFAIAGPPSNDNSFRLARADVVGSDTSVNPASTASDPNTSLPADAPSTSAETVEPSTGPSTSAAPLDTAATTTPVTEAPTTTQTTTTTVDAGPLDRADVRLVVANGDGRFNLAGSNGNRLKKAGYLTIDLTDVADQVPATILYYRPDFEDEARIVAGDLLVPNAILEPLPSTPVTINDQLGDVIIVLGPDAVR